MIRDFRFVLFFVFTFLFFAFFPSSSHLPWHCTVENFAFLFGIRCCWLDKWDILVGFMWGWALDELEHHGRTRGIQGIQRYYRDRFWVFSLGRQTYMVFCCFFPFSLLPFLLSSLFSFPPFLCFFFMQLCRFGSVRLGFLRPRQLTEVLSMRSSGAARRPGGTRHFSPLQMGMDWWCSLLGQTDKDKWMG